jgi:hypothetical protein
MLTPSQIDILHLFNEKAAELEDSTFYRLLSTTGITMKFQFDGDPPIIIDTGGLGQEHVKAFVLTARFFIQDNEQISFHKVSAIYCSLASGDPLRVKFESIRDSLETSLNAFSPFRFPEVLTYRHILNTFIYGKLAHANSDKRAEYQRWSRHIVRAGLISNEFTRALKFLLVAVLLVRQVNVDLLLRDRA